MPGWCAAARGRARRMRLPDRQPPGDTWRRGCPSISGHLAGELLRGHAARFIDDPRAPRPASPPRLPWPRRRCPSASRIPAPMHGLNALLEALDDDEGCAALYVRWELDLLAELGFGLDLSHCAATGAQEHLIYVSPRSGQAVSEAAGAPYREQLLRLPRFLLAAGEHRAARARRHARRARPDRLFPRPPRAGSPTDAKFRLRAPDSLMY